MGRATFCLGDMQEDRSNGLHPAWVCATIGTTSSCAVDDLTAIGDIGMQLPGNNSFVLQTAIAVGASPGDLLGLSLQSYG
jgi:glutamate/tyrosine decarboxylase-like PLP-dependent enzyme